MCSITFAIIKPTTNKRSRDELKTTINRNLIPEGYRLTWLRARVVDGKTVLFAAQHVAAGRAAN